VLNVLKNGICETHLADDYDSGAAVLHSVQVRDQTNLLMIFLSSSCFHSPPVFTRTSPSRRSLFTDIVSTQFTDDDPPLRLVALRDRKAPTTKRTSRLLPEGCVVPLESLPDAVSDNAWIRGTRCALRSQDPSLCVVPPPLATQGVSAPICRELNLEVSGS